LEHEGGSPVRFTAEGGISAGRMYAWIEIQYRTVEYPDLPQYYKEPVSLAPISIFAAWSQDEKIAEYRRIHGLKLKAFEEKYTDKS
jgi:hypothetical protein